MNIKQAKEQIRNTLRAYLSRDELGNTRIPAIRQRPVLLIGPPGIGKTQIMEQLAAEENVGLVSYTITHHTRQSAIGLPFIEKRNYDGIEHTVTEYTMSEILGSVYELMEKTGLREGILFLDEINCVSETLAPMMLQFLQCKTFGNQKLVVTLDRVKRIPVEEDFPVWKEYALRKGLHGAVISYLDLKKENFYRIENSAEGMQFATARGWEDLSEILYAYEALGIAPDTELAVQYVQMPAVARDFTNYYALYNKYRQIYHIDDILHGLVPKVTVSEFASAPFDEKLAVMGLTALHDAALAVRSRLPEPPVKSLRDIVAIRRATLRRADNAGQEDREQKILCQTEINRLEEYIKAVDENLESEEQMDAVRTLFAEDTARRESLADETGRMFDCAFRFLEDAVGQSQELVLFVSEITAGYDTSWYVGEFGCDAYFRHNRELLFDQTRQNILDRLTDHG